MSALTEFLFPAPARRTAGGIISWWEKRRFAYNAVVGTAGLVSLGSLTVVASIVDGTLSPPPWPPVLVFGVLANLCYFLGPCAELLVHTVWGRSMLPVGPALYRMGLTFSVGLALFPTLLAVLWMVVRVVWSIL